MGRGILLWLLGVPISVIITKRSVRESTLWVRSLMETRRGAGHSGCPACRHIPEDGNQPAPFVRLRDWCGDPNRRRAGARIVI